MIAPPSCALLSVLDLSLQIRNWLFHGEPLGRNLIIFCSALPRYYTSSRTFWCNHGGPTKGAWAWSTHQPKSTRNQGHGSTCQGIPSCPKFWFSPWKGQTLLPCNLSPRKVGEMIFAPKESLRSQESNKSSFKSFGDHLVSQLQLQSQLL